MGNPSDAFGGAIVTLALDELAATVRAEPALRANLTSGDDEIGFRDLDALVAAGEAGAYPEGANALLMAAAKRYAAERPATGDAGVSLSLVGTTIPPGVGLAGSSAIVIAALRALGELFGDEIREEDLPSVALACERDELGIAGGLGDRVAQTFGGLVFLDLARPGADGGAVRLEPLDPDRLPNLFIAWIAGTPTHSGTAHRDVLDRFAAGDEVVVATMREIADLARQALKPLLAGDAAGLGLLMERNLELRRRIYELDPRHVALAEAAGEAGAPINYTGSGGAIVGLFRDDEQLQAVRDAVEPLGAELLVRRRRA